VTFSLERHVAISRLRLSQSNLSLDKTKDIGKLGRRMGSWFVIIYDRL